MDHENNAPSLLKLIEDYDPIFFELFVDQKQVIMDHENNAPSLLMLIGDYDSIFLVCFLKFSVLCTQ
ncbi:hypothetical protein Hanom_Chr00s000005g01611631 [Helianthus anomalus]